MKPRELMELIHGLNTCGFGSWDHGWIEGFYADVRLHVWTDKKEMEPLVFANGPKTEIMATLWEGIDLDKKIEEHWEWIQERMYSDLKEGFYSYLDGEEIDCTFRLAGRCGGNLVLTEFEGLDLVGLHELSKETIPTKRNALQRRHKRDKDQWDNLLNSLYDVGLLESYDWMNERMEAPYTVNQLVMDKIKKLQRFLETFLANAHKTAIEEFKHHLGFEIYSDLEIEVERLKSDRHYAFKQGFSTMLDVV